MKITQRPLKYGTLLSDLVSYVKHCYFLPDNCSVKITPAINQRAFVKDKKYIHKTLNDIFDTNKHTFDDISVFIDIEPETCTMYIVDGGQRVSRFVMTNMFLCLFFLDKGNYGEGNIFRDVIHEIKNGTLLFDSNDSFQFRFSEDIDAFEVYKRKVEFNKPLNTDDMKDKKIAKYEDVRKSMFQKFDRIFDLPSDISKLSAEKISKILKDVTGKITKIHQHLLTDLYIGMKDYTESGMSMSEVYCDCCAGAEQKPYEYFEGALLLTLENESDVEEKAKFIHDDCHLLSMLSGKDKAYKKEFIYDLATSLFCNISRPTFNWSESTDRTLPTVSNGTATELIKHQSVANARAFYNVIKNTYQRLTEFYGEAKLPAFRMLCDSSLNSKHWFVQSALQIVCLLTGKIINPQECNYSDSFYSNVKTELETVNECIGLLLMAYICTRGATVDASVEDLSNADAQMDYKIYNTFKEELYKMYVTGENCDSVKAMQNTLMALTGDADHHDRCFTSPARFKAVIADPTTQIYPCSYLKESVKTLFLIAVNATLNEHDLQALKLSIEHIFAQTLAAGRPGWDKCVHCLANLALVSTKENSSGGAKLPSAKQIDGNIYYDLFIIANKSYIDQIIALENDTIETNPSLVHDLGKLCEAMANSLEKYFDYTAKKEESH